MTSTLNSGKCFEFLPHLLLLWSREYKTEKKVLILLLNCLIDEIQINQKKHPQLRWVGYAPYSFKSSHRFQASVMDRLPSACNDTGFK
jgi:hypothetical protein